MTASASRRHQHGKQRSPVTAGACARSDRRRRGRPRLHRRTPWVIGSGHRRNRNRAQPRGPLRDCASFAAHERMKPRRKHYGEHAALFRAQLLGPALRAEFAPPRARHWQSCACSPSAGFCGLAANVADVLGVDAVALAPDVPGQRPGRTADGDHAVQYQRRDLTALEPAVVLERGQDAIVGTAGCWRRISSSSAR